MNIKVLTAVALLVLSTLLLGCTLSAQSTGTRFPLGTKVGPRNPRVVLDRLSGGGERVSGSGRIVTENFDIRGFNRVDVSHAFQVEIVQGGSYEIEVRVDENLQPHLRVERRGDTLVIGLKPAISLNTRNVTMEAKVRMPDLRGIQASGASDLRISGFSSAGDFEADLSGASFLEGDITARDVDIEASGASKIRLQGRARDLRLDLSGASNLDLGDFPAEDADIELSGASEVEVVLNGTLDIDASGASRLYFGGNPTMGRIDLSGASSIKRR
ncbi:MAG: DUF2807 domain-containing protein [Spirochaetaceae bacterium]|nr:MAG: DUF2807 domain-containing protein [Spirochaetaceae bacterium]